MILDNAQKVLGIELAAAAQALRLRGPENLSAATAEVYRIIREEVPPVEEDVVMYPILEKLDQMVKSGRLVAAAESVCGPLV